MLKYELTDETKVVNGVTLYRIRALKDYYKRKAGDLGGFIESEKNLTQEQSCWVDDNSCVYGNAQVSNAAIVSGNAIVHGYAKIRGCSLVFGNANISGNVEMIEKSRAYDDVVIFGNVKLSGMAKVYADAHLHGDSNISTKALIYRENQVFNVLGLNYLITGYMNNRSITAYRTKDGYDVICGGFTGSLEDFKDFALNIKDTKGKDEYIMLYDYFEIAAKGVKRHD